MHPQCGLALFSSCVGTSAVRAMSTTTRGSATFWQGGSSVSSALCLGGSDTVVGCSCHPVPTRQYSLATFELYLQKKRSLSTATTAGRIPAVSMLSPALPLFALAAGSCVAAKNSCQAPGPDTACNVVCSEISQQAADTNAL